MNRCTLKALRGNSNLTQKETAEKIGVSTTTWSRWENKERFPDAKQINKIAEVFGVSYDDIIFLPE